jgi:CheY-like chemotaxis protein
MMPRKNGWDVLDELRSAPETRDVPVVLTSAVYDRIGRRPLPFGGPIRFAAKPFDINELIETIEGFRTRQGQ